MPAYESGFHLCFIGEVLDAAGVNPQDAVKRDVVKQIQIDLQGLDWLPHVQKALGGTGRADTDDRGTWAIK